MDGFELGFNRSDGETTAKCDMSALINSEDFESLRSTDNVLKNNNATVSGRDVLEIRAQLEDNSQRFGNQRLEPREDWIKTDIFKSQANKSDSHVFKPDMNKMSNDKIADSKPGRHHHMERPFISEFDKKAEKNVLVKELDRMNIKLDEKAGVGIWRTNSNEADGKNLIDLTLKRDNNGVWKGVGPEGNRVAIEIEANQVTLRFGEEVRADIVKLDGGKVEYRLHPIDSNGSASELKAARSHKNKSFRRG